MENSKDKKHYFLTDTHCHLDMKEFDDLDKVIGDSFDAGVERIIVPSVDASSFDNVIKIANKYENVFCALGIHPTEAKDAKEEDFQKIIELFRLGFPAQQRKIVAIGECGLDYYWDKTTADIQREVFIRQIEIANEYQKPLLIHDREAHKETFDILVEHARVDVVMHCFSGSPEFALECTKKGFYVALGGVVTFKNAKKVHEVAQVVPLDKLLLETDAPFLAPTPHRGKRNEPAYVKLIAAEIAKLRNIEVEELTEATAKNVNRIFKI